MNKLGDTEVVHEPDVIAPMTINPTRFFGQFGLVSRRDVSPVFFLWHGFSYLYNKIYLNNIYLNKILFLNIHFFLCFFLFITCILEVKCLRQILITNYKE